MARPTQELRGQSHEEGALELLNQLSVKEAIINELKNALRGLQFDNDTKSAEAQESGIRPRGKPLCGHDGRALDGGGCLRGH